MKLKIQIEAEHLAEAIDCAMDGIGYWCDSVKRCYFDEGHADRACCETNGELVFDGGWLLVTDEAGKVHHVDEDDILRGLAIMADKSPFTLATIIEGRNIDATVGDVLIQLACFGEVRYG